MINIFKFKKKKIPNIVYIKENLTIEFVEEKSGVKLTFPHQKIPGSIDEEKYLELKNFGCSDIWDDKHSWYHRDCFNRNCKNCAYFPIVEKYNMENEISNDNEIDLIKAGAIFNFFEKEK